MIRNNNSNNNNASSSPLTTPTTTRTAEQTPQVAETTRAFISAFVAGTNAREILDTYFAADAEIHEHGPPFARSRLPFLGQTFAGRRRRPSPSPSPSSSDPPSSSGGGGATTTTLDDYYALLSATLVFKPDAETIPPIGAFCVDARKGIVTVRARAGFESVVTGKGWREEFVYVVGFEAGEGEGGGGEEGMEGGEGRGGETRKIKRLDLWADPLSAWIAVGGEDVDVGVGVVGVGEEGKGKKEKT